MSYSKIEIHYRGDGINSAQGVNTRQGVVKKRAVSLNKKVQDYGDKYGYSSLRVDYSLDHLIIRGGGETLLDKDINGDSNEYIRSIESYDWLY